MWVFYRFLYECCCHFYGWRGPDSLSVCFLQLTFWIEEVYLCYLLDLQLSVHLFCFGRRWLEYHPRIFCNIIFPYLLTVVLCVFLPKIVSKFPPHFLFVSVVPGVSWAWLKCKLVLLNGIAAATVFNCYLNAIRILRIVNDTYVYTIATIRLCHTHIWHNGVLYWWFVLMHTRNSCRPFVFVKQCDINTIYNWCFVTFHTHNNYLCHTTWY